MIEPINVWELDAGKPKYHVPTFHMIAAINSANTMAKPALLRLDADLAQVRAKLSRAPKVQNRPCLRSGKRPSSRRYLNSVASA
jgi:hypothetical protein